MISYDISRLILSTLYDQYIAPRLNYDTCTYIHSLINLLQLYYAKLLSNLFIYIQVKRLYSILLVPVDDGHYICGIEIIVLVMELRNLVFNESQYTRKTKRKAYFDGASFQFISDLYYHWKLQND